MYDIIICSKRVEEIGRCFFVKNKPILLRPCIYVYRGVRTILKIPLLLIKWLSLGFFFTMWVFISMVVTLIETILKYGSKGWLFLSYILYKIEKYFVFGIAFPFVVLFRFVGSSIEKARIAADTKRANKQIKAEAKKLQKARALEEKQRKKEEAHLQKIKQEEEKKEKRKKEKEVYINENVKIEKKSFGDKLNDALVSALKIPQNLVQSIKNKYANSTFVKNKKNKKDINRQALLISFEGEDAKKSSEKVMYEYVGKNAEGKVVKGYFAAFSKVEVHSFLLSEGFEVYSIKTNKLIQMLHSDVSGNRSKIKNKDLIFFLTQLSTYIKAGIPLVESLKILSRQYKNKTYQRIFRAIIYDLTMGDNFSDALTKQGEAFPKLLINMVKASELTGELPEALDDMADYYSETEKTRKQMVTALMYPSIVFVISVGVITFIMLFVVPKFVEIYESMDSAMVPAFTRMVLNISDFLQDNIIWIALGIVIFIIIMKYLYDNVKVIRTMMQWFVMHMPVFGNVVIYNEVTMFTKTFASLLAHNVFITDSMEVLNKITNNEIYKMLILDTITNLAKGEKISLAFKDHWAFPIPAYEMIVTGEKTGQLAEMMAKVSNYYQDLHKNAVARIKTFVEPVLIIFLTVIVGFIVLSIVIPMFNMYQAVQGA